jgi:hypothetical protein
MPRALDRFLSIRISHKDRRVLGYQIVQADQKRYKDNDPESNTLVPVSYITAGILAILIVAY